MTWAPFALAHHDEHCGHIHGEVQQQVERMMSANVPYAMHSPAPILTARYSVRALLEQHDTGTISTSNNPVVTTPHNTVDHATNVHSSDSMRVLIGWDTPCTVTLHGGSYDGHVLCRD